MSEHELGPCGDGFDLDYKSPGPKRVMRLEGLPVGTSAELDRLRADRDALLAACKVALGKVDGVEGKDAADWERLREISFRVLSPAIDQAEAPA